MTCIIGILDGSKVYLAGDSCASNGYTYGTINGSKVFKNDEFVMGITGYARQLDLLQYSLHIPFVKPEDEKNMDKFVRTSLLNAIRQCFKDGGYVKFKDSVENVSGYGSTLIGYKDKLWVMYEDFSIINCAKYEAIGCGAQVAIGSLFTTQDDIISIEERINIAMNAAASVLVGVKGPFNIITT